MKNGSREADKFSKKSCWIMYTAEKITFAEPQNSIAIKNYFASV